MQAAAVLMSFSSLLAVCLLVFVCCLLSGSVPLLLSLPQRQLRYLTTFGVGLLIGCAFVLIIPEGISSIYSRSLLPSLSFAPALAAAAPSPCLSEADGSEQIGAALALGFVLMLLIERVSGARLQSVEADSSLTLASASSSSALTAAAEGRADSEMEVVQRTNIIHIPSARDGAVVSGSVTAEAREKERERQRVEREKERERAQGYRQPYSPTSLASFTQSATVALLLHSAVVGVALAAETAASGAAPGSASAAALLSTAAAVALQAAPAAFGLVSFLMFQRRGSAEVWTHLTALCLCLPLSAIAAFLLLSSPLRLPAGLPSLSSASSLGLGLLFAGGAFLFSIAVHVMPALSGQGEVGGEREREKGRDRERDRAEAVELETLLQLHPPHAHSHAGGQHAEASEAAEAVEPLEWRFVASVSLGLLSPLAAALRSAAVSTQPPAPSAG